ncbi:MAG: hypothetical protein BWX96_03327 [Bacteroidetes bacterium ADurb.Bin145]|nr:MAG: hypothetical protein BWX96_03327 [Bacteroidetes bacterium ADurb.Bin145]
MGYGNRVKWFHLAPLSVCSMIYVFNVAISSSCSDRLDKKS